MNPAEELISKLKALLGTGVDATIADAKDLEARAKEAKMATKATDIDAGTKALDAVKALEDKLAEQANQLKAQADELAALKATQANVETAQKATQANVETAQKAHQARAEKAIKEVADLMVTLNAKPPVAAPPEQAKLDALEAATKAKVEQAMSGNKKPDLAVLQRYTYNADGTVVSTPIQ